MNPASTEAKTDLGIAYFHSGEILEKSNKIPAALKVYQKTLKIDEEFLSADPTNADLRTSVADDFQKISAFQVKLGDNQPALNGYVKAIEIYEDLVALDAENADYASSLAVLYDSLGASYILTANADGTTLSKAKSPKPRKSKKPTRIKQNYQF